MVIITHQQKMICIKANHVSEIIDDILNKKIDIVMNNGNVYTVLAQSDIDMCKEYIYTKMYPLIIEALQNDKISLRINSKVNDLIKKAKEGVIECGLKRMMDDL